MSEKIQHEIYSKIMLQIFKPSGYWHPDCEQEIECEDDPSTTAHWGITAKLK